MTFFEQVKEMINLNINDSLLISLVFEMSRFADKKYTNEIHKIQKNNKVVFDTPTRKLLRKKFYYGDFCTLEVPYDIPHCTYSDKEVESAFEDCFNRLNTYDAGKTDMIAFNDITVSLFRETYPRKLTEALKKMAVSVTKTAPGIYRLDGRIQFPTQIVVMKELNPKTGPGMRVLSKKLQLRDIANFFQAAEDSADQGDINNINAILYAAERANDKLFRQAMEEMTVTDFLEELIKDRIEEREAKSEAKGRAAGEALGRDYCAELMGILLKAGRIDDALRAASDKTYLNRLIDEMVLKKADG